ncbi:hypothetical protein GGI12_005010 [Dipsacomyces acuminosporus]|nr:hypothetical protein GGI12_005010 [Dipsacomyces acuminosporus]
MHVNDLGYDVLHRVFAILDSIHDLAIVEKESSDTFRKEAYRLVKALSSVSRSWRALTLPYRYKKLQFSYTGGRIKSTAKHIIGLGYSNIPQVIEISIKNTSIDKINLADKMSKVAIGQASWLQIRRVSYLNNDMAKVKPASYESDYQNISKHVHFPVLEKLRIENYPYDDDGFYRLFDESPLRRISIEPHGKAQCRISHRMLPIAEDLFIQLNFDYQEFKRGGFKGDTNALRKSAYVDALASLVSCSSTVRTAHIALYLYDTASLPDTLSWGLMTNLELEMFIDMRSLFTVLLQMPKLQRLRFYMYESQPKAFTDETATPRSILTEAGS